MTALLRVLAPLLLITVLSGPIWAAPSTGEYLSWLESRRQLWVQEMKRMEAHEHGQFRTEYHRLSEQIAEVREQAQALRASKGEQEGLRRQLVENVGAVEQGLEFLLSEVPEMAERP